MAAYVEAVTAERNALLAEKERLRSLMFHAYDALADALSSPPEAEKKRDG